MDHTRHQTLPDTTTIHATYTSQGRVEAAWGAQTYPTFTTYDYAGRIKTLRTRPDFDDGVPVDSGGSETIWIYNNEGRIAEKNHHGENDDGTTDADYTYTPAGRLKTRTWERGVTTSYYYSTIGRLRAINYSDSTPDVFYTHDRPGNMKTAEQGTLSVANGTLPLDVGGITITAIRGATYTYDPIDLHLAAEAVDYGGSFTRTLAVKFQIDTVRNYQVVIV